MFISNKQQQFRLAGSSLWGNMVYTHMTLKVQRNPFQQKQKFVKRKASTEEARSLGKAERSWHCWVFTVIRVNAS